MYSQPASFYKVFQALFITAYISLSLFCIFKRIESWPFSDYRLFSGSYHPTNALVFIPYFKLSNGEYFNPSTKEIYFRIDRDYFHKACLTFKPEELEAYLQKMISSDKMNLIKRKMIRKNLDPVKFIVMKVLFKETKKRFYTPVYIPEKEYDI